MTFHHPIGGLNPTLDLLRSLERAITRPDLTDVGGSATGGINSIRPMNTTITIGGTPQDPTIGIGTDIPTAAIAGLVDALANLVPTRRALTTAAGSGLTGGGPLTADRALSVVFGTTPGTVAQGNDPRLAGAAQDSEVVHLVGDEQVHGHKSFIDVITVPMPVNATDAASRDYVDTAQVINARKFLPHGDAMKLRGIAVTAGSNVLIATAATPAAGFTQADVGKTVVIGDFNGFTRVLTSTITAVTSATQVVLAANSPTTLSGAGAVAWYGTDDTTALNAWLAAAGAAAGFVDTGAGPNMPMGLSQAVAWLPHSPNGGAYLVTGQLTSPAGVLLDGPGLLVNAQSDLFNPVLVFQPYSSYRLLRIEALFGCGIVVNPNVGVGADAHGGDLVIWNVGNNLESGGAGRSQDALVLNGYGHPIATRAWIKGGRRGIVHQAGSDCIIAMAHLIGCRQPIFLSAANQVHYGTVILDTCGNTVPGNSGIVLDNGCSLCTFADVNAFEVVGSTRLLDNVMLVGAGGAGNNTQIRANIIAQRTGGNVLNLARAQDCDFTLIASNTASASSGGSNITTALVWGASVAGGVSVKAVMNTSVIPYSGTPAGDYTWIRGGVVYRTQAGTAPTAAVQLANGGSPPGATVTGNNQRGVVSFGTGTAPAAGDQVVLTFADPGAWVNAPKAVKLTAGSDGAALAGLSYKVTSTTLTIRFAAAPAASQAAGVFVVAYSLDG